MFDLLLAISEDCSITYLIGCITHTKGSALAILENCHRILKLFDSLKVTIVKHFILEVYIYAIASVSCLVDGFL